MDDSPLECAEVRARCGASGLVVVQLPTEAERYPAFLEHCWVFDAPPGGAAGAGAGTGEGVLTEEDATRTQLYRQLAERKKLMHAMLGGDGRGDGDPSAASGGGGGCGGGVCGTVSRLGLALGLGLGLS